MKKQYRGQWIPPELGELIDTHEITPLEFVLLLRIDALVNWKGIGCWETNKKLAAYMQLSKRMVISMIKSLKSRGLIIPSPEPWMKIRNLKYRVIECFWSRIYIEGRSKRKGTGEKNDTRTDEKNNTHSTSSLRSEEKENTVASLAPEGSLRSEGFKNPFLNGETPNVDYLPVDKDCAITLHEALHKKGMLRSTKWSIKSWSKEFALLRKAQPEDSDNIERVLDWYIHNIGGDKIPEAFCASSFRDKFPRIQAAMYRKIGNRDSPQEWIWDSKKQTQVRNPDYKG